MRTILRLVLAAALGTAVPAAAQYLPEDPDGTGVSYTALWWVPAESGWGLNTNHQGDKLFATLFTYARDGQPLWLVGPGLEGLAGEATFTGTLYRTTGPPFHQVPWSPIGVTEVGIMSIEFLTQGLATLTYTYDGATVTKSVVRQVFSAPVPECTQQASARIGVANY